MAILDTERIERSANHTTHSRADSLAAEVQATHPAARAFIDLVLGGYVKCDELEALLRTWFPWPPLMVEELLLARIALKLPPPMAELGALVPTKLA